MKNRSMDLLKYQPLPELAAALRARCDAIIQRWHAAVQASRAGRVLPLAFTALVLLVYASMVV